MGGVRCLSLRHWRLLMRVLRSRPIACLLERRVLTSRKPEDQYVERRNVLRMPNWRVRAVVKGIVVGQV